MRVAFVADVHIGNHKPHGGKMVGGINKRCQMGLGVLDTAVREAIDHGVDAFVSLGDLFDTTRPSPQVIRAVQHVFNQSESAHYEKDARIKPQFGLLLGNHERVSQRCEDHALAPLEVNHSLVFEKSGAWIGGWNTEEFLMMVPFQTGHASDWVEGEIDHCWDTLGMKTTPSGLVFPDGKRCVGLCLHLGICDEDIAARFPWARESEDQIDVKELAELCHRYRIPRVYAGNWHGWKEWKFHWPEDDFECVITQVGALVPTGWDNPGVEDWVGGGGDASYGCVALLGCDVERLVIPGPRFVNVKSAKELAEVCAKAGPNKLFVRAKCPPQHIAEARAEIQACVKEVRDNWEPPEGFPKSDCVLHSWEVVVDQAVARESVQRASAAARSEETLKGAVSAYFEELDVGADKVKVEARVMTYLGLM